MQRCWRPVSDARGVVDPSRGSSSTLVKWSFVSASGVAVDGLSARLDARGEANTKIYMTTY